MTETTHQPTNEPAEATALNGTSDGSQALLTQTLGAGNADTAGASAVVEKSQKRTCKIERCDRPHCARGLCRAHYVAAHARGSLTEHELVRAAASDEAERFFSKVDAAGICWNWSGGFNKRGYGRFVRAPGREDKLVYAHRWAWEHLVSPIPDAMTLDHLCRNTACVNPDHLELVTAAENTRRATGTRIWCKSGRHRLAESRYVRPDGTSSCGECMRERNREWCRENRPSQPAPEGGHRFHEAEARP